MLARACRGGALVLLAAGWAALRLQMNGEYKGATWAQIAEFTAPLPFGHRPLMALVAWPLRAATDWPLALVWEYAKPRPPWGCGSRCARRCGRWWVRDGTCFRDMFLRAAGVPVPAEAQVGGVLPVGHAGDGVHRRRPGAGGGSQVLRRDGAVLRRGAQPRERGADSRGRAGAARRSFPTCPEGHPQSDPPGAGDDRGVLRARLAVALALPDNPGPALHFAIGKNTPRWLHNLEWLAEPVHWLWLPMYFALLPLAWVLLFKQISADHRRLALIALAWFAGLMLVANIYEPRVYGELLVLLYVPVAAAACRWLRADTLGAA
ncbi:hypothetical protein [Nannocystis pusilla]|uniref:hypothetical protein n=1 Tax=Nannocystis pusilla TaxID=889268 RepID=UPI003B7A3CE8